MSSTNAHCTDTIKGRYRRPLDRRWITQEAFPTLLSSLRGRNRRTLITFTENFLPISFPLYEGRRRKSKCPCRKCSEKCSSSFCHPSLRRRPTSFVLSFYFCYATLPSYWVSVRYHPILHWPPDLEITGKCFYTCMRNRAFLYAHVLQEYLFRKWCRWKRHEDFWRDLASRPAQKQSIKPSVPRSKLRTSSSTQEPHKTFCSLLDKRSSRRQLLPHRLKTWLPNIMPREFWSQL